MTNLYRQNKGRGGRWLLIATIFLSIVFLIDVVSGGSLRSVLRAGASNVWSAGSGIGEGITGTGLFSSRRALEAENRSLRGELAQLKVRAAAFDVLKEENQALRDIANVVEDDTGRTVPIASSLRSSPYGTFLIGAGAEEGVRAGNLVIAGDPQFGGFVVGRVHSTDAHTSLVRAVFASGEKTDAVIRDIEVVLEGRGGGQARTEAPRGAPIEVGDAVTSPVVQGRAIGIVGAVEEDVGAALERVYVTLPISLSALQYVYVVEN